MGSVQKGGIRTNDQQPLIVVSNRGRWLILVRKYGSNNKGSQLLMAMDRGKKQQSAIIHHQERVLAMLSDG